MDWQRGRQFAEKTSFDWQKGPLPIG